MIFLLFNFEASTCALIPLPMIQRVDENIELFSMCPRCRLPSELKIKPPIKCKVCSWTPNNNKKKMAKNTAKTKKQKRETSNKKIFKNKKGGTIRKQK